MNQDDNNLQSIINFLYEQPSIPHQSINKFIQYLHHFSQLGILFEPKLSSIFSYLHKLKDQNNITNKIFQNLLKQLQTIDYISIYHHSNLLKINQFLNEMIDKNTLTHSQVYYILNRLIELCQTQSLTNYDIKIFLINIQQNSIYSKIISYLDLLTESLSELQFFENLLLSIMNHKRLPDDIRKRLNEMIFICKQIRYDKNLVENLFGEKMNYKFYERIKNIVQIKNFFQKKQYLNMIIQIHKEFIQISHCNSQKILSEQDFELIFQGKYSKDIENIAKLGYLQVTV